MWSSTLCMGASLCFDIKAVACCRCTAWTIGGYMHVQERLRDGSSDHHRRQAIRVRRWEETGDHGRTPPVISGNSCRFGSIKECRMSARSAAKLQNGHSLGYNMAMEYCLRLDFYQLECKQNDRERGGGGGGSGRTPALCL
jgi:hypothetical protein